MNGRLNNRAAVRNGGFSIIETLIAITILMVAIAGPFVVASKGLTGALASKDLMVASYLAQESMETVKNLKENNVMNGAASWLTGISGCTPSAPCDASPVDSPSVSSPASPLTLSASGGYYSHDGTGTASPFSRNFYLTQPGTTNVACASSNECVVNVFVAWYENTVPYQVTLRSQITATPR